ncbi:MAG: hypothetical protein AB7U35_07210 [Sphingobium sp.]
MKFRSFAAAALTVAALSAPIISQAATTTKKADVCKGLKGDALKECKAKNK